ncbi:MAG: hypothetical protein JWN49_351 [Parcubacteria group bacterium]|nr:hypothetical protein [Parcubacteria group bacterium]
MWKITANFPLSVEDNRLKLFFRNLATEKKAQGGFKRVEFSYILTSSNSFPNKNNNGQADKKSRDFDLLSMYVYEIETLNRIVAVLRTALSATWPEYDDLLIIERVLASPPQLSLVTESKK